MSYKLKKTTGGVLQIGMLQDLNGSKVNIATNKAAIQAVWKDADGNAKGGIAIAENAGDDYDCLMTIRPSLINVSGVETPTPDCSGNYRLGGSYEGENYYIRDDGQWYIWYNGVDGWLLSPGLGIEGDNYWTAATLDAALQPQGDGTITEVNVAVIADNESLPLGTHTIRLESSTDVILPRNVVIDVISEAAYNQMVYGKGSGFTQRG